MELSYASSLMSHESEGPGFNRAAKGSIQRFSFLPKAKAEA
jgi:hypothetical protein